MQFVSFFRSFTDWKKLLKRVLGILVLAVAALVWNLYALCYLNDTFDISRRAVFGKATAYLLAGVANRDSIIGLPPVTEWINTISLTAGLYFLAAIAVRALVQDLLPGRIKKTFLHFKTFRAGLKNYRAVARKPMSAYVWSGLAIAAVLNILVFNPFAVCLLGVMLLLSCMKQEDGGIVPLLMIVSSSLRYRRVMKGKAKAPRFGEYELKLFGLGIGLLICTVCNVVLWFVLNFNFWVRLVIMVALILFAAIKQGIVKVNKPTATALIVLSILAVQLAIVLSGAAIPVLADDCRTDAKYGMGDDLRILSDIGCCSGSGLCDIWAWRCSCGRSCAGDIWRSRSRCNLYRDRQKGCLRLYVGQIQPLWRQFQTCRCAEDGRVFRAGLWQCFW